MATCSGGSHTASTRRCPVLGQLSLLLFPAATAYPRSDDHPAADAHAFLDHADPRVGSSAPRLARARALAQSVLIALERSARVRPNPNSIQLSPFPALPNDEVAAIRRCKNRICCAALMEFFAKASPACRCYAKYRTYKRCGIERRAYGGLGDDKAAVRDSD